MEMKWFLIILALVYLLSPYDLIPGYHGLGWLDDIVILILLYRYLGKTKSNPGNATGPFETRQEDRFGGQARGDGAEKGRKPYRTPYEVLNLPPDADPQSIRAAYRQLAKQYHPDKVSHLGKEFQELAEQRFKEIKEAYEKLAG
jgi:hypothetical protein